MRLIFVYNAEAGIVHGIMDSVHKTISPSTYSCDLCAVTYGMFTMDKRWRAWLKTLDTPAVFYHRADFKADWPDVDVALPVVMAECGGVLSAIISAGDFKQIDSVDSLVTAIESRLKALAS